MILASGVSGHKYFSLVVWVVVDSGRAGLQHGGKVYALQGKERDGTVTVGPAAQKVGTVRAETEPEKMPHLHQASLNVCSDLIILPELKKNRVKAGRTAQWQLLFFVHREITGLYYLV